MSTAVRLAPVEGREKGGNEHRRQAGAAADADDAGVGQRVFHHSLQQHTGYGGCCSAEDGDEDAGKPQVVNGRHVFVVFNKESFEQFQGRHLQAAGIDGNQEQRQQPQSSDHKGENFLSAAYHRQNLLLEKRPGFSRQEKPGRLVFCFGVIPRRRAWAAALSAPPHN